MSLDDAMIIVNPCEYTLEDFERDESSANYNTYGIPGQAKSEEESI